MHSLIQNKKFSIVMAVALAITVALFGFALSVQKASAVQSPAGCTADNSVVNISSDVASASAGDTITFTVSAGNPASADGCDITGRTLTLTLPDGSVTAFGPFDYPNPTPVAFVGSAPYLADNADAVGGFWTANVSWNGTLKSVNDLPSTGSKNASVLQVIIDPLVVTKTSRTAFERAWDWDITKSADQEDLLLSEGESFTVNYTVDVSAVATDTIDASGTINVTNPVGNPSATVTGVTDELSIAGTATVTCPGIIFPHVLAAGASFDCTYQLSPDAADAIDQTNTATATTSGNVPGDSDTVPVDFSAPVQIDECITVDDTNPQGPQDVVVCQDDPANEKTFTYPVTFGPAQTEGVDVVVECGEIDHDNTASYTTNDDDNDTDENDSATETVHINVECFEGCTLTQGYWKTHNDLFKGGAPSDETWELLSGGEETIFFLSAKSWFDVFWTAPKGNVYYNLAHQYMAAKLNILAGAVAPANVTSAITSAETLFGANTPAQAGALKGAAKNSWTTLAGTLGSFNEGVIGPGHCDEQNPV